MDTKTKTETEAKTQHGSIASIMCADTNCQVRYHEHPTGSETSRLFLCDCITSDEELDLSSFPYLSPYLKHYVDRGYLHIIELSASSRGTDTISDVRIVKCGGNKCRIKFGSGISIHCESCFVHIIDILRDYKCPKCKS